MIYNGMKLALMIGHFPDVMEKDQYLKPENFKYFETADFKSDHYVEFTNGRKLPISVIDTVYDLGDDYVTFEAVVEFNTITPINMIMLVKFDIKTDECDVIYMRAIKGWHDSEKLTKTLDLQVKRKILNIDKVKEYFNISCRV